MQKSAIRGMTAPAVLSELAKKPDQHLQSRPAPVTLAHPLAKAVCANVDNNVVCLLGVADKKASDKPNCHFDDEAFVQPSPSLAARSVAVASTSHFSGRMVIPDVDNPIGRILLSESKLEISWAVYLLTLPEVETVIEQVPFRWLDEEGKWCTKFFDLVIVFKNGRRVACEIKPEIRLRSGRVLHELSLIAAQARDAFDDVRLLTDKQLSPDAVFNAELIYGMRRPDPEADAAAARVIATLAGSATMRDLRLAIDLGGRGMPALVRLLGERRLRLCDGGRIHPNSLVRKTEVF